MVSVCIITYNHENYIEECINSILAQKTNFDFELVIGEDGSSDNTRERIHQIIASSSREIHLLPDEGNLGMMPNFVRTLKYCKGDYIAICEGDDFWIDPTKLQKQIDYLDSHPEYIACYTDIQHMKEIDGNKYDVIQQDTPEIGIEDLFAQNYVTTMTAVFRNGILKFPENFKTLSVGDWPLFVLLAQYGKIKRLPFISAVYRIHQSNNFQANSYLTKKLKMTEATEFLYRHLKEEFRPLAKKRLISSYYILANQYLQNGDSQNANRYYQNLRKLTNRSFSKEALLIRGKFWQKKLLNFLQQNLSN